MDNFFKNIQQFPQRIKDRREKLADTKQEMITYLLKSYSNSYPSVWFEFNGFLADGKLLDDKEISSAIKEGYLRALKQYVGELPILKTTSREEERGVDQRVCFDRTKVILDIFSAIESQKWEKNNSKKFKQKNPNYARKTELFTESFKDNPEFFRLTKESLIKSLNQADTGSNPVLGAQEFIPALTPDELKKSPEVQEAAQNAIIRALQDDSLSLAIDFQEWFQLTEEMIQSPRLQQAAHNAIQRKEEKLRKIREETEKNPMLLLGVDKGSIWQIEQYIEKIKNWTMKGIEK